jgi:hypothetical protein
VVLLRFTYWTLPDSDRLIPIVHTGRLWFGGGACGVVLSGRAIQLISMAECNTLAHGTSEYKVRETSRS